MRTLPLKRVHPDLCRVQTFFLGYFHNPPSIHPKCVRMKKLENCLTVFHKILSWGVMEKKNCPAISIFFFLHRTILVPTLDKDYKHFCSLKRLPPCFTSMHISQNTRLQRCCSDTEKVQNVSTSRLYGCTLSSIRFYVKHGARCNASE